MLRSMSYYTLHDIVCINEIYIYIIKQDQCCSPTSNDNIV